MRATVFVVLAAAGLLPAVASPHHSMAMFNFDADVSYEGVVTKFAWSNPHIYIYIDVEQDGKVWSVRAEGNSPRSLRARGWSRDMMQRGDLVTLTGHPMGDGSINMMWVDAVTLADGKKFGDGD